MENERSRNAQGTRLKPQSLKIIGFSAYVNVIFFWDQFNGILLHVIYVAEFICFNIIFLARTQTLQTSYLSCQHKKDRQLVKLINGDFRFVSSTLKHNFSFRRKGPAIKDSICEKKNKQQKHICINTIEIATERNLLI